MVLAFIFNLFNEVRTRQFRTTFSLWRRPVKRPEGLTKFVRKQQFNIFLQMWHEKCYIFFRCWLVYSYIRVLEYFSCYWRNKSTTILWVESLVDQICGIPNNVVLRIESYRLHCIYDANFKWFHYFTRVGRNIIEKTELNS